MVKEMQKGGKTLYVCETCGFAYEDREWARKCQEWDDANQTCNIEIIEHGAPLENIKEPGGQPD